MPKQPKRTYQIHDPNPAAATAEALLSVLIQANLGKAEQAIQAWGGRLPAPTDPAHSQKTGCAEGAVQPVLPPLGAPERSALEEPVREAL